MNKTPAQKREFRRARVRAKLNGTESRPRLVVFRSLSSIYAQLIDDTKGKTIVSEHDLKTNEKMTKTESAKAVGMAIAKKATAKGITECVFDRNGYMYHGRTKAVAEGAREGGLKF